MADAVAAVAMAKEETWEYALPEFAEPIAAITVGLDGNCKLMSDTGRREAMVGTFGFYNKEGDRLHTVYTAATLEYGKLTFFNRFERELDRIKQANPEALYVGVADGAKDNWTYLDLATQKQVVDFYHTAEYICKAAIGQFAGRPNCSEIRHWIDEWCHRLKHEPGGAESFMADLKIRTSDLDRKRMPTEVESALTYFGNQVKGGRMNYHALVEKNIPIGSGLTEAACKVLVKQRLCGSGAQRPQSALNARAMNSILGTV